MEAFLSRVMPKLLGQADSFSALEFIDKVTGGDFYVFGGTMRRALLNIPGSGDLDVMIPNGDERAIEALESLGIPCKRNSQDHKRFVWNNLQIDIFPPKDFYKGFETVFETIKYFDLKINSLAVHWKDQQVLDPFDMTTRMQITNPEINWERWDDMHAYDLAVLAIRLARIMFESPQLRIEADDVERIRSTVLPEISALDWAPIQYRYPPGREAFLQHFEAVVFK